MRFWMIVKGNAATAETTMQEKLSGPLMGGQALGVLERRDLDGTMGLMVSITGYGPNETIPASTVETMLNCWMVDTTQPPFPNGSLLYWRNMERTDCTEYPCSCEFNPDHHREMREALLDDGPRSRPVEDPVEAAQAAKRNAPCSCGEPGVGSLYQCDRHHGVGCNCLACCA